MPRRVVTLCTWLALLASGCAGPRPALVEYDPARPVTRTTRIGGDYLLVRDDGPHGEWVITRQEVRRGGAIGFARDESGLVAVAGVYRIPLADGRYRWRADEPQGEWGDHLPAPGRLVPTKESIQFSLAVSAIALMAGVFVYGLCDPKAVGMDFRH